MMYCALMCVCVCVCVCCAMFVACSCVLNLGHSLALEFARKRIPNLYANLLGGISKHRLGDISEHLAANVQVCCRYFCGY